MKIDKGNFNNIITLDGSHVMKLSMKLGVKEKIGGH